MKRTLILLTLLLICAFEFSCAEEEDPDYSIVIESNTTWSGAIGNATVDGSGNRTIHLGKDDIYCCVVQKQTTGGYLRAHIIPDGESAETTAAYGVVSVCNQ